MGPSILAIALVPPEQFAKTMIALRVEHPGAKLVALVVSTEWCDRLPATEADEYLLWRSFGLLGLVAEVRRRRFDAVVVAHGRDQYTSRSYWKALALALASGAPRKLFCQDGRLVAGGVLEEARGVSAPAALVVGAAQAALQIGCEAYVTIVGVLLFAPVVVGSIVTDLTERVTGGSSRPGRSAIQSRER